MLVEIAGDEMFFQVISRTGKTVDSGVIQRQAKGASEIMADETTAPAPPHVAGSRSTSVAVRGRAPAAAAARRGDRAGLGQHRPGKLFPLQLRGAFAVNDVAMVFFFALMTKEVVEATAPGGVLHRGGGRCCRSSRRSASTAVPALLHMYVVEPPRRADACRGWPVTFATESGVSYFVARLIFGSTHSAIPFVIPAGITCDAAGLSPSALFNPTRDLHLAGGVLVLATAMSVATRSLPLPHSGWRMRSCFWLPTAAPASLTMCRTRCSIGSRPIPSVRVIAGRGPASLVRSFVELHGGSVTLELAVGRGTTVT